MILSTHIDGDTITHILPGGLVKVINVGEPLSAKIIYPEPDDAPDQPAT